MTMAVATRAERVSCTPCPSLSVDPATRAAAMHGQRGVLYPSSFVFRRSGGEGIGEESGGDEGACTPRPLLSVDPIRKRVGWQLRKDEGKGE